MVRSIENGKVHINEEYTSLSQKEVLCTYIVWGLVLLLNKYALFGKKKINK